MLKVQEELDALPMDDLIDVICLLHDMGHPPFGHGGEGALNALMGDFGGFESNAQTLRLITHLEMAYEPHGLDLTRRTLLGILKYPVSRASLAEPSKNMLTLEDRELWVPKKSYYAHDQSLVEWILEPLSVADRTLFQTIKDGGRRTLCLGLGVHFQQ
jgi:dGTPase